MSGEQFKASKTTHSKNLRFFSGAVSALNEKRQELNRGKSLARYLTATKKNLRSLAPLDSTLGVMSFSLYLLRLVTNLALMVELTLADTKEAQQQTFKELSYSVFNDSLWSIVNLIQFFYLSLKKSPLAGLYGMQLETVAQFIDLVVMIIRHEQNRAEFWIQHEHATESERRRLAIEWQYKELNSIRAIITGLTISIVLGLVACSIISIPLAPIIAIVSLTSSLGRVLINFARDKQLIEHIMGSNDHVQLENKKAELLNARLQDINQIIVKSMFIPLGFVLLLTAPVSSTVIAGLSMMLMHYLITKLIDEASIGVSHSIKAPSHAAL